MVNNVVLSTRNIDDFISDVANEVVKKINLNVTQQLQPTETERWFDLNELCNYLPDKPAKATVYAWVHTGVIPCHKGQKKLRFFKSEIDNWLRTGKRKTLAETANEADQYLANKKRGNNG